MRVLSVRANMAPVWGGGAAERALQMNLALAATPGVEATLLTLRRSLTPKRRSELRDVRVVALACVNGRYAIPAVKPGQIAGLLRTVDVIHLSGHWSLLNALVYRQARRLGVPYVLSPEGTLVLFGRSLRLKWLYNRLVGTEMIRNASRLIVIADSELPYLRGYGVTPAAIANIPNGVRPDAYRFADDAGIRRRLGIGTEPFLLYMGRLNPIKGPDLLIEGFARVADRFPAYQLVLAGPDEGMGGGLRTLARRRGVESRVRFVGHISGPDKSAAYHAAELLVIPSRHEAMSIVALESGAAGTPLVFTDQCGLDEVARIGGGFVVAATIGGISEGLVAALEHPDRLPVMGEQLKAYTLANFSWDAIGARVANLLREVSEERRGTA